MNKGKEFEKIFKTQLQEVGVFIQRIPDIMDFRSINNIADFYAYSFPYMYLFECKTTAGKSLPFANISETQWNGLLEASKHRGIISTIPTWFYDMDVTKCFTINELEQVKKTGSKSIRYDSEYGIPIDGKKRKVYFDYDMGKFVVYLKEKYGYGY